MGPTASGKTDLAIELAEDHGCELISILHHDACTFLDRPSAYIREIEHV